MPRPSQLTYLAILAVASTLTIDAQQNELRSMADGLAGDIAASGKKAIAVVDFVDLQGNTTELGRFLAEEFSVALLRTHKGFEMIERTHLKSVLNEHKLATTGLIDPATAKKLGQMIGADALVTGSMTPFSESIRVTVKVIATDTARIVAADDVDLPKTRTISQLMGGPPAQQEVPKPPPYIQETAKPLSPPALSPQGEQPKNDRPSIGSDLRSIFSGITGAAAGRIVISNQLEYELIQCRGLANSVTCELRITNRGPDRRLIHNCSGSKAFDNFGNQSGGQSCMIANQTGSSSAEAELVSGISVPTSFVFERLNPSASFLSLISITGINWPLHGVISAPVSISFRHIPIAR
jgi:TolB-like protein